jgi:hypothetical protein
VKSQPVAFFITKSSDDRKNPKSRVISFVM